MSQIVCQHLKKKHPRIELLIKIRLYILWKDATMIYEQVKKVNFSFLLQISDRGSIVFTIQWKISNFDMHL